MKTKNFPAKKLKRQIKAKGLSIDNFETELETARNVRTKKFRGNKNG